MVADEDGRSVVSPRMALLLRGGVSAAGVAVVGAQSLKRVLRRQPICSEVQKTESLPSTRMLSSVWNFEASDARWAAMPLRSAVAPSRRRIAEIF